MRAAVAPHPPAAVDRLRALVAAARLAPSGDNLQPFVYRLRPDAGGLGAIEVRLDAQRADHVLDRAGHASRLTLGMAMAAMRVQAGVFGQGLDVHLLPAALRLGGPERGEQPWAEVRPLAWDAASATAAAPALTALAPAALASRHTDRRRYQPPPGTTTSAPPALPFAAADEPALAALLVSAATDRGAAAAPPAPAALAATGTQAARLRAVHVALCDPRDPTARGWLIAADAALWRAPAITADALRWVRFAPAGGVDDGVSFANLGLPLPLAASAALARALPSSLAVAARLGGPALTRRLLEAQLDSSTALLTIASRDASAEGLVVAGEVAMRVWCRLCAAGWAAQPLSLAPILALAARDGAVDPAIPRAVADAALQGWFRARAALGAPADAWPAFVLRAGPNSPVPAALRPGRRSLAALLGEGS